MKLKRPLAMLCALAITLGGVTALAATQGSQEDPLLTLSYLEKILKPQLESQVDAAVEKNQSALKTQLDQAISDYETRVSQALAATGTAAFQSKTLAKGEQLTPGGGRELLLVSGSASAVGSLTDVTGGKSLKAGDKLELDHLYVTAGDSAGCKADASSSVMVR